MGRSLVEEYKFFTEDRAEFLRALHSGVAPGQAVQSIDGLKSEPQHARVVQVEGLPDLIACLPQVESETFYKLVSSNRNPLGLVAPTVVMQTFAGEAKSYRLCLHVVEAKTVIEGIHEACKAAKNNFLTAARVMAKSLHADCSNHKLNLPYDRRVLVVRGLGASLDAAAKKACYRPEVKTVVDLLFAELMIQHNMVVVQAVRLSKDLEMILREFALACFHYQLLTQQHKR
jgi:hypothetical protein